MSKETRMTSYIKLVVGVGLVVGAFLLLFITAYTMYTTTFIEIPQAQELCKSYGLTFHIFTRETIVCVRLDNKQITEKKEFIR